MFFNNIVWVKLALWHYRSGKFCFHLNLIPFILLPAFCNPWYSSGIHSTRTLKEQNPVNISKIANKTSYLESWLSWVKYNSINANKWANSTDGGREEKENEVAHFQQLDCETIPLVTVRENDFTAYILIVLNFI